MARQSYSRLTLAVIFGAGLVASGAFVTAAKAGPTTEQSWAETGYSNPDAGQVVPIPAPGSNAGDAGKAINGTAQRRIQNTNEGSPQP